MLAPISYPPRCRALNPPPHLYCYSEFGSAPLNYSRRCLLLMGLNEYGNPGPCLGTAWADTDNPVYQIEINEINASWSRRLDDRHHAERVFRHHRTRVALQVVRTPKPSTPKPVSNPESRISRPQTPNPKHSTLDPTPFTLHPTSRSTPSRASGALGGPNSDL